MHHKELEMLEPTHYNIGKGANHINYASGGGGPDYNYSNSLQDLFGFIHTAKPIHVDKVNKPHHYAKGDIECIDALKASMSREAFLGLLKGSIMQYVWRYEDKGGIEDLNKALWYLNRLTKELTNV